MLEARWHERGLKFGQQPYRYYPTILQISRRMDDQKLRSKVRSQARLTFQHLIPFTSVLVNSQKTESAEHATHNSVTDIWLQKLVRTAAGDHFDSMLAA